MKMCELAGVVAAGVVGVAWGAACLGDVIGVQQYLQTGAATLTASPWDIGSPDFIFDGDPGSVYRSAAVNPAVITVQFSFPVTTGAARAWFTSGDTYEWTLEAADTVADLDAHAGTYVQVFGPATASGAPFYMREWNAAPVTRRVYRFTVERLTRDDFVHIYGLELQSPEAETVMTVGGQPVRINTIVVTPSGPKIAAGASRQFEAEGSLSFGPERYDLTGLVSWSTPDPGVISLSSAGVGTGVAPGRTVVRAIAGPVVGETVVDVRAARPADLNVGWIHRTPEYNRFTVSFDGDQHIQPGLENEQKWPAAGEMVTYTAHVFNKGDAAVEDVAYRWVADGVVVDSGVIPSLGPLAEMTVSYVAPWPADEVQTIDPPRGFQPVQAKLLERAIGGHTIRLELDPDDVVAEACELNNAVEDDIGAMSFWFYMDESMYQRFSDQPSFLESYSPEDWLRGQLTDLQRRLLASGVRQRLRLDKLVVVEDGALNTGGVHEPAGTSSLGGDGRWGFSWPQESVDQYAKMAQGSLCHELGHQLGLIDVYNYDVATDACQVRLNGALVAGTALMPLVSPWNVAYGNQDYFHTASGTAVIDGTGRGMMADPGVRYVGAGTAAGLNRDWGLRRGFFGDYLLAVQPTVRIRLIEADGSPVAGASLRVLARELNGIVPDNAKFAGTTDADGTWTFPGVTLPGWNGGVSVLTPWSFTDGDGPDPVGRTAVLVVEATFDDAGGGGGGRTEYHFIEVDDANVAMQHAAETGTSDGFRQYTYELMTYESRQGNTLPVISFDGSGGAAPLDVFLNEGDVFEATISAFDADADEVALSATPLYNSSFDPATGVFRFEPDSYLVNVNEDFTEGLSVFFRADDGKFRSVREMRFHVADVPDFAIVKDLAPAPACACERTGDSTIDVFDLLAYLDLWFAADADAELTGDAAVDVFDLLAFLDCWFAGGC